MKKANVEKKDKLYCVVVYKYLTTKKLHLHNIVAVFDTFNKADNYITCNLVDKSSAVYESVEVQAIPYGAINKDQPAVERYIYKYDRIMRTYFQLKYIAAEKA